jgi:hypothetical protein
MRVVDRALLGDVGRGQDDDHPERLALGGLIGGDPVLPIWVGETGIDPINPEKVRIDYPVPFATYTSAVGDDDNPRLTGRKVRRSVPFYLIYVGSTLDQTKAAGERLRLKLQHRKLHIEGVRTWHIHLEESQRVRRDDNVMRPDGSPLWYGIDSYAVSIMFTQTGVTPA